MREAGAARSSRTASFRSLLRPTLRIHYALLLTLTLTLSTRSVRRFVWGFPRTSRWRFSNGEFFSPKPFTLYFCITRAKISLVRFLSPYFSLEIESIVRIQCLEADMIGHLQLILVEACIVLPPLCDGAL